jgi:hypothetical protein
MEARAVPERKKPWRGARGIGLVAILALAAVAGYQLWRRLEERYPLASFERSREAEQIVSLRSYAARERLGSFLPPGDAQLAIRENLLQRILAGSLPFRQKFEDGRYEARLDRARLDLEDGLASIRLLGHGRMIGPNASPLEADLVLQTHIDVISFRPDVGTLRAGLAVTGVHVIRAGQTGSAGPIWNPVARYFSGLKGEDWNRERPTLEIPIHLEQRVRLPAVDGDLSLAERSIPLDMVVSAVTVHEDRLVLSIHLEVGDAGPAGGAARDTARGVQWLAEHPGAQKLELKRLYRNQADRRERDLLIAKVAALADSDRLWQGLMHSDRDVVAIVPEPLLQTLCDAVSQDYLQGARLNFDPNLRAKVDQHVRVKLLGGKVGAGRISGRVRVVHLKGRLRVVGKPKLDLLAPNRLEFATPVEVLEGNGLVRVDMNWDPSFLVAVLCRGFDFQSALTGEVVPFSHVLHTRIRFVSGEEGITGVPVVRRDKFDVPCAFTAASMAKVRSALIEQDRFLRCGMLMDPDAVFEKISRVISNDIRVRLPSTLFKPFTLPVRMEGDYEAGDFHILARARDPEVAVRDDYLRFGFRAELIVRPRVSARAELRATREPMRSAPDVRTTHESVRAAPSTVRAAPEAPESARAAPESSFRAAPESVRAGP